MGRFLVVAALAAVGVAIILGLPDIKKFLKIRSM